MTTFSDVEISLSTKGLANLPRNVYEDDFTFIVGDSRYRCPSFLASFLSPRICRLQTADPTLREFVIETKDPNHYFESIIPLCSGSTLRFTGDGAFFQGICGELGNRELYEQLFGGLHDCLTISNVIDRIKFLLALEEDYESEIEFCSSHFYELDFAAVSSLSFEIFAAIVSNDSIRLKDEDTFYQMICSRIAQNSQFSTLLEYVRFEYLSAESIQAFIALIDSSFDFLIFPVWRSLCRRLSLSVSAELEPGRFYDSFCSVVCPFSANSQLDGIILYLTKKFGGHVIDRDLVSITSSGIAEPLQYPLRNIADFENEKFVCTTDEPNSWICYDFKEMRVNLTHYSIRSRKDENSYHLRSWVLEGSNDGSSWVEIDRREKDLSLNSQGGIASFAIAESLQQEYKMIRIRQIGKNSDGYDEVVVNAIEFFGIVKEQKQ